MYDFKPGQRWLSDSEPQLGLGTILKIEQRHLTVVFNAGGEIRTYSIQTAPLRRVLFERGDMITSHEGWCLKVESVAEDQGLMVYQGTADDGSVASLHESQLDNFLQLNRPTDRLLSGQIDSNQWFILRQLTHHHIHRLSHFPLRGLTGGRTSLIDHQLYIAHEVTGRYAPRVLLADEVGLGKTIEAGMIIHQQLVTEQAGRVLIIVPESLVHQWFVEMYRRFNLHFCIFDDQRLESLPEEENPFTSEQLILCSLDFVIDVDCHRQILQCDWDLLVVDEAHHLQWSPQHASAEYTCIEKLAAHVPGVLLLTATPEQLGKSSHFARLRLLDPDRYPDYESFCRQEQSYHAIADTVEALAQNRQLTEKELAVLHEAVGEHAVKAAGPAPSEETIDDWMDQLLDRHGTGRVLFRNTRNAVQGFPQRCLHPYPLATPREYLECFQNFQNIGGGQLQHLLCPEVLFKQSGHSSATWTSLDPRLPWLIALLKEIAPEKAVLITATADTAMDLAKRLKRAGIKSAVFHEHLSIVERDRSAAYFADKENGSRILLCSEIGSEGRNFQFAHHLILFDLPLNPDLLEQRIGRLDRIGQTRGINIHVPYMEKSPQEVLLHWYHRGLNAFEHTCPAGHDIFSRLQPVLTEALHQIDDGMEDLPALVDTTVAMREEVTRALQEGRDRLIEFNSCRPRHATKLKQTAQRWDQSSSLPEYMELIFDCFAIDTDIHRHGSYIVYPSNNMYTQSFPGLPSEGMTMTYDRDMALAHEDIHYLSWDHPLVIGAMDLVVNQDVGKTAMAAIIYPAVDPGTLMFEAVYVMETGGKGKIQPSRYLPPTTIRILLDQNGNDHTADLNHDNIRYSKNLIERDTAEKIVKSHGHIIRELAKQCELNAQQQADGIKIQAHEQSRQLLQKEINRLEALRKVNPNVRLEEISHFQKQHQAIDDLLDQAAFRLDSARVIIVVNE